MKPKIISVIFVMVLVLSACSGGSVLEQNREKWEGQNFNHYRFTVVVSCFCPFAGAEVTYEVQNGQMVGQAVQAHPDRQFDPDQISEFYQDYNTIEKVFNYVERASNEADETTIEYDPTYGFPTDISVDWIKEAIDDEFYLTLSNFEPL
jgi:Family of unknown function (DUF6174)